MLESKINMFHLVLNHIVSTPYEKQQQQPQCRYKSCSLMTDTCGMHSKGLQEKEPCVFVHNEYHHTHSARDVRTFWGSENILTAPHNFKGLFQGQGLVLQLEFGLGFGLAKGSGLVGMVGVRLRG